MESDILNNIKKRSVPLGIIGSISKSLFGTMNEEDAKYINAQIDRLFSDQTNITQLVAKQMHIAASNLQQLHQDHVAEAEKILKLHDMVQNLWTKLKDYDKETARIIFNEELMRFEYLAGRKLEQYAKTCETYIRVISAARDGRYDAAVLSVAQLSEISREIQLRAPEFEFPLTLESLRGEALAKITRADLTFHNGRVIIALHIPLLDRTHYHLYRMHIWPVPQEKDAGSAYISPATPYIVISEDRRTYFQADGNYISSCMRQDIRYMCTIEAPLHEISLAKKCEIEMLIRPSNSVYRRCDVRSPV